jgi:galactonate dehydratase
MIDDALGRRAFLRTGGSLAMATFATACVGTSRRAPLKLLHATLPDPDGHHPALRLRGDWLIIGVTDGRHTGVGEISHNGDDAACLRRVRELFDRHVATAGFELSLPAIQGLERGAFAAAADFITATAISGLNQALLDLTAKRAGVPVWRLFRPSGEPVQRNVACYLTLNRALRARAVDDYLRAVEAAAALGVHAVKVAPFERVQPGADQLVQSADGFARLAAMRAKFPQLLLRVDCHERFTPENARALLPKFDDLGLEWLEEPCPPGAALAALRTAGRTKLAIGELYFGESRFRELLEKKWADVIMPDPKHVGGFGPLLAVCRLAERFPGAQVSPHNPSGPVATAVALQAAALSPAVTSLELILTSEPARQPGRDLLAAGRLRIPDAAGWGLPPEVERRLAG